MNMGLGMSNPLTSVTFGSATKLGNQTLEAGKLWRNDKWHHCKISFGNLCCKPVGSAKKQPFSLTMMSALQRRNAGPINHGHCTIHGWICNERNDGWNQRKQDPWKLLWLLWYTPCFEHEVLVNSIAYPVTLAASGRSASSARGAWDLDAATSSWWTSVLHEHFRFSTRRLRPNLAGFRGSQNGWNWKNGGNTHQTHSTLPGSGLPKANVEGALEPSTSLIWSPFSPLGRHGQLADECGAVVRNSCKKLQM